MAKKYIRNGRSRKFSNVNYTNPYDYRDYWEEKQYKNFKATGISIKPRKKNMKKKDRFSLW